MAAIEYRDGTPPLGQFGNPLEPWPFNAGASPLELSAHRGKAYLLVAEPLDLTQGIQLGLFGPLGEMPYPEGGNWGWLGLRSTLYVAATHGGSTRPDDVPASTYVPSKLAPPDNFGTQLFTGVNPQSRGSSGEGVLTVEDPDGELDYLFNYIWDSAPLTLKRGEPGTPFASWDVVARYTAANIRHDLDTKTFTLRDLGWQLSGPLHSEYYGGTGGLDGDASLKGRWKPYAVGYCGNVEPVMLNASRQIVQVSCSPIVAVLALKHGGVPLDFHADYPTYEALVAADEAGAIPSGKYATCLASALALANVELLYGLRLDVIGDSETAYGHGAPLTRAAIARRVATTRGASRLDDTAQIDMNSFADVEARHSAPVGWYWSDLISKADALTEIMAGILGWWRIRPSGELSIGFFDDPARGSALDLTFMDEGMGMLRVTDETVPRAGTLVGWRRNYGPQSRDQLAGVVDAETAAILASPARYAQALAPHVAPLYPTAPVVTIEGNYWFEVDAEVEAARQQSLFSVMRYRWQWDMELDPFVDIVGTVLTLKGVNRVGLGAAKPLLIAEFNAPGDGKVILGGVG